METHPHQWLGDTYSTSRRTWWTWKSRISRLTLKWISITSITICMKHVQMLRLISLYSVIKSNTSHYSGMKHAILTPTVYHSNFWSLLVPIFWFLTWKLRLSAPCLKNEYHATCNKWILRENTQLSLCSTVLQAPLSQHTVSFTVQNIDLSKNYKHTTQEISLLGKTLKKWLTGWPALPCRPGIPGHPLSPFSPLDPVAPLSPIWPMGPWWIKIQERDSWTNELCSTVLNNMMCFATDCRASWTSWTRISRMTLFALLKIRELMLVEWLLIKSEPNSLPLTISPLSPDGPGAPAGPLIPWKISLEW